jgi:uncharacterized membrane protein YdjX (TVP38/TMEM64 family)
MPDAKRKFKAALFLALAAGLFLSQFFWDASGYFQAGRIREFLEGAGLYAPVVYMLLMALAVVISPIPSLPLDIAAGAFFGPIFGTFYSVLGALAGAVMSFLLARFLGRELVERFLGGHINFCTMCSDRLLTKIVFLSRLIPVVSFDVVSYGAGLTKMSLGRFALSTFLGMIPLTFLYNYSGSVLVFGKGLAVGLGMVMVGLFFIIPWWIEKRDLMKAMIQHQDKPR